MINDTRFIFCTGLQIVYSSKKKERNERSTVKVSGVWSLKHNT